MQSTTRFLPHYTPEELGTIQLDGLKWTVRHAATGSDAYAAKFRDAGIRPEDIRSLDDLRHLPCTSVEDLRDGYPFPLLSVPERNVVRMHASSGTTGKRKVLTYTQKDVNDWMEMMARCYELAGLTELDRIQICAGYGLWTAGAGFQLGAEHFGAMAVPVGPGNMNMQLQLLVDMGVTCMCSTASMALLMGEEVEKHGLRDSLRLRTCIFGSETHTPKMRQRFTELLGIEDSFDISGMTELYGPGAGLECAAHDGIHYWADMYIVEILDPETLEPVQPGEVGEMVVTTLRKEAAPLIRYRTHDLTRLIPGECSCGLALPRHDKIMGRSDDMIIFRGVNIYPGQIAAVLGGFDGISSEYQVTLARRDGRDFMTVAVERAKGAHSGGDEALATAVGQELHRQLMARAAVQVVDHGALPRSFGKTRRVIDDRENGCAAE
jgi:phenylacetate-CoA ligase